MRRLRAVTTAWIVGVLLAYLHVALAQPADGPNGNERDWQPNVDSYTVEPGDTLWDITSRVVGKPWLWPRVWAYNPEITNPNWIYPGDMVRFYPSDQPLPSLSEEGAPLLASREAGVEDLGARSDDEHNGHPAVEVINTVAPQAKQPSGPPPPREWLAWVGSFVTPDELSKAGTLTHAADDKLLLATNDEVYLAFPKAAPPKSGKRYLVYRTVGRVRHPVTHDLVGYMSQVTGVATIDEIDRDVVRARLGTTLVEVERGQYVMPFTQDVATSITEVKAPEAVKGVVLALNADATVVAGAQQLVFIDKGTDAGLVRGNRFKVVVNGDPVTGDARDLPDVDIATLLVVDVKDKASTCLVLSSRREIEPGDRVEAITQ